MATPDRGGPNKRAGEKGRNVRGGMGPFSSVRQEKWLELYRETGRKYETCNRLGISYNAVKTLENRNEEFKLAVAEARELYCEAQIEATIHARAIDGWDEPVWYQGVQVGTVKKFSDSLLLALAKRHIEGYSEKRKVTTTHNVQGTIGLEVLEPEERDALRAILERRKHLPSPN